MMAWSDERNGKDNGAGMIIDSCWKGSAFKVEVASSKCIHFVMEVKLRKT